MSTKNKVIKAEPQLNERYFGAGLSQVFIVVGQRKGIMQQVIDCRCYRTAKTVRASLHIQAPDFRASGYGKAGGGGYDKTSAAVGAAIRSAGIGLRDNIDGRGDAAIQDALTAIAEYLGYKSILVAV